MIEVIHYREYPLGWGGRVLDAVWAVAWPIVVGSAAGVLVLVLGFTGMELEGTLTRDLDLLSRISFGFSIAVVLGLWLLACLVSAARSLFYARRLAGYRADGQAQYHPPTPSQRAVARAVTGPNGTKPFVTLRVFGVLLLIVGGLLAVIALLELGSEGAVPALIGGAVAAAVGVGLLRLVVLLRRMLAAVPVSWRHSPNDPGNAEQGIRPIALPLRYRVSVWADRVVRVLGCGALAVLAAAASMALGPAARFPSLLPWVLENRPEPTVGLMSVLLVTSGAIIVLLLVALVLELLRHGILLGVLDREATNDTLHRGVLPTTRPDPRLTKGVLSARGPARRATQLLAGIAAFVLIVARPAVAALEARAGAEWGEPATALVVGAVGAIILAFGCELFTAGRDRERRNRLLRTWPRAL